MKAILGIVIFVILLLGLLTAAGDPQYLGPNNPQLKAAAQNGGLLPWPNQYNQQTGQLYERTTADNFWPKVESIFIK